MSMRYCQIDCDVISEFDLFGKEPEFYYKGRPQRSSWFGQIFSVLYIILYIAFLVYKLVRMIQKVDIDFYETYAFSGIPSIKLNNDIFYGGFSIGGKIDETIYYPVLYHYTETMVNGKKFQTKKLVPLTICSLDKFGKRFQSLFQDEQLDNFYCIEKVDDSLAGYSSLDLYSYYYIAIMPCVGKNYKDEDCKPIQNVTEYLQQTYLEFKMQDLVMTPHDYDNPSEARTMDIRSPVFIGLYQSIYAYMQIVNLETDEDWLGFEALADVKKEQFLRYEESWIIAAPSPHTTQYGLLPDYPVTDITVQLSAKVLTTKRTNTKMIDVLGDVGGLMEVLSSLFNIICIFVSDLLYDIDMVNTLFSFDLKRKKVVFKNSKKDTHIINNNDDEINVFNNKKKSIRISESIKFKLPGEELEEDKNENKSKYKIALTQNYEQTKPKKKRKKLNQRKTINSSYQRKKELNSIESKKIDVISNDDKKLNEVENQTVIGNNNNLMASFENIVARKSTENGHKNELIEEIKINKFFIIFAFCCIRKRKNMNSIALEEGINLISKRLDVLNIFKRLYYDEKLQKDIIKGTEEVVMSERCKEKLS